MTRKEMFNFGKYTFICWSWSKSQRYDRQGDPKYLVREIARDDDGNIIYDECLEEFVMYEEAKQFIKEIK